MNFNPYENNSGWEGYDRMQPAPIKTTASYQADGLAERVIVPGLIAVIVGVAAGLLAGLLIGAFHLAINPWWTMPIVALSVFLAIFWGTSRRGQWLIERIAGADLNGDSYIGQPPALMQQPLPPALPEKVRVELIQNDGRQCDYIDLPANPDQLKALATGIVSQHRQFALTLWAGEAGIFTRSQFEQLRAEMIERGLAEWKKEGSPNQGCQLTRQGLAVMRYLASDNYHPTTRE